MEAERFSNLFRKRGPKGEVLTLTSLQVLPITRKKCTKCNGFKKCKKREHLKVKQETENHVIAKNKAEDDIRAKEKAEEEVRAKRKAEEDMRAKEKAEKDREKKKAEDEIRTNQKAEEEVRAKKKAEEDRTKKKAEDEIKAKKKAEDDIKAKKKAEDDIRAKKKAEEEVRAKKKAEEDMVKKKADDEIKIKKEQQLVDPTNFSAPNDSDSNERFLVDGRYSFEHLIGSGSFGKVFFSWDNQTNAAAAMKLQSTGKCTKLNYSMLKVESKVLSYLQGGLSQGGFPQFFHYCSVGDTRVLVMELLGSSLKEMFKRCSKQFTLKTMLLLIDQLLVRLQCLHNAGIIHRDLKPENMAMGIGDKKDVVYLIDFGLASSFWSCYDKKTHIPEEKSRIIVGTSKYMSANAQQNLQQSRRDDMESLAYIFLYFCTGDNLPWCGLDVHFDKRKGRQMLKMKQEISPEQLFVGWPLEFAIYLKMVRQLEFGQEPEYLKYRQMFWGLAQTMDIKYDAQFDWNGMEPEEKTNENEKDKSASNIETLSS